MKLEAQESFFNDQKTRFSTETIRAYRFAVSHFFSFCQKNVDEVKAKDIRDWLGMLAGKGLKPSSLQMYLSALKSLYQYLMEESIVKKNPTLKVHTPKKDDSLPYYLTKRQFAELQELTRENPRDRVMVDVLYYTGVRISELLNIKLEDIKWDNRQIWIRKGKGNKERFVLFSHECAERLKTYLDQRKSDSQYIFSNKRGRPLCRDLVELRFRQHSKSLGFRVTPHTLRHTFAAHLAEKGMEFSFIQELLGHKNINTTRIYTRLMNQARKNKYDQYQI